MVALVQGMPVVLREHHPLSIQRIPYDWTKFAAGSGITLSEWAEAGPVTGITLTGAGVLGLVTSVMVSSGTAGLTAYIENRVTFSDGRKDVMTIIMPITTKVPA